MNWISSLLDRAFAVMGALVIAQAPLYIQHYSQQLSGHVSELQIEIDAMKKVAFQSGKSLEQYIQKFVNSEDSDFKGQGEIMRGMTERWSRLSEGLAALQNAAVWERPFVFAKYFNWEVASATLRFYKLGIPLTLEGLAYALIGVGIGYLFFLLLRKFFGFLFRLFKRVPPAVKVEETN